MSHKSGAQMPDPEAPEHLPYEHLTDLSPLEQRLGHSFENIALLERALTHRSYANEQEGVEVDNQRLEFLGDAVLGLVTATALFQRDRTSDEGVMSSRQSQMVCETALADLARKLELGNFVRLGRGEILSGGRDKSSLLADAYEAVLAAIYLDGGFEAARRVILNLHAGPLEELLAEPPRAAASEDFKSRLQRAVQSTKSVRPQYRIVDESGPAHAKIFVAAVDVEGKVVGRGSGRSKKQAEQRAAAQALEQFAEPDAASK